MKKVENRSPMILAYVLLVAMIIIWAFSFIIVDIAVEFLPPLSVALYRFLIASIALFILDLIRKRRFANLKGEDPSLREKRFTRKDWILIGLASFSGVSVFFYAQYNAINLIGPSLPALFVCLLAPVIIAILALIFFKEKLNAVMILGFGIATIGGFLLITGGDISTLSPESPSFWGYFLALLTPVLWAIYTIITKRITKTQDSGFVMLKQISYLGTLELFIFVILNGELFIFLEGLLNIIVFLSALYLGLGCYVIGYYIWQNSQKAMKSSKVASFLYVEPFITLIFALLLQREETIVIWNLIGGIIVLIAVILINYQSNR